MNERLISYRIISAQGISSNESPATEALSHIKQYMKDNSAWLYVDSKSTNVEDITLEILESASRIDLAKALLGG